jgi:hypothetical protein
MKICIPSKGRASAIKTHLFFKPEDVLIFVEPQEVKKYKIFWPEYTVVDIKKTDQGISYVRNFIIDNINEDKLIMADDDINYFGLRNSNGRYDKINDLTVMVGDIDKGLDEYWGYSIPSDVYAYFENKSTDQLRFHVNKKSLISFYGLNTKELKKHNVHFDNLLEIDDLDFTIQILLNDGKICSDYKYAMSHDMRTPGGISSMRKLNSFSVDLTIREHIKQLTAKYGPEFINFTHDSDGYAHSCSIDVDLIQKRKEIARKNYEKYLNSVL